MSGVLNFFIKISEKYGIGVAIILVIVGAVLYIGYTILKQHSLEITKHLHKYDQTNEKAHTKAAIYRKSITPEIRKILSNLAEETKADRALLFEFSNGSSNLVGLPFLYATATCEVVRPNISTVAHIYQRINIAIFAEFLEKLESAGYFYVEDLEKEKDKNKVLYDFMIKNNVRSALFYSLYGVDDTVGFIVITTVNKTVTRKDTLPRVAEAAQIISSLLNYDKLHEELE